VYLSESLALACLEVLVHIRPLPRRFRSGLCYTIEIPESELERPKTTELPKRWNLPVAPAEARDFGTRFLIEKRAVGLVVPSAIVPRETNALINPLHPKFRLDWITG